jgi:hypothetical protein
MLSLKATLKAIAENISTIKTALDGKATKYTGYGTPVTLTTSWYTMPSDGIVYARCGYSHGYIYIQVKNADGGNQVTHYCIGPDDNYGWSCITAPVFKGQQVRLDQGGTLTNSYAQFIPFV